MTALKNIEVRIRHINEGRSVALGTADDVDGVIPLLRSWGLHSGEDYEWEMAGQFVLNHEDREAYFEVLVGDDE